LFSEEKNVPEGGESSNGTQLFDGFFRRLRAHRLESAGPVTSSRKAGPRQAGLFQLEETREEGMKKSNFTEVQVVHALKQAEVGVPIEELLRKYGISRATFYAWRKKYGGLDVAEMRRLRELETENKRLKGLVADFVLDKQILQEVLAKKD
jgi:putative transposase